jgi:Ras-related protein Rab-6A
MFIESSAKAGFNVKALFRKLATALPGMDTASNQPNTSLIDIKLSAPKKSDSGAAAKGGCAC